MSVYMLNNLDDTWQYDWEMKIKLLTAQSAGAVEYTECISAEG